MPAPAPKSDEAKRKPTAPETARARRLRQGMTGVERRLWSRLRAARLGVKFRRQEPILTYTVDFVCHERRLIVELDGHQHQKMEAHEARRTASLEAAGYRILRFWNSYVVDDIDSVVATIHHALDNPVPDIHAVPPSPLTTVPPLPPGVRTGEGVVASAQVTTEKGAAPSPQPSPRGGEGAVSRMEMRP